jgi:hypothetical protein
MDNYKANKPVPLPQEEPVEVIEDIDELKKGKKEKKKKRKDKLKNRNSDNLQEFEVEAPDSEVVKRVKKSKSSAGKKYEIDAYQEID